jgi:hypothetical protein
VLIGLFPLDITAIILVVKCSSFDMTIEDNKEQVSPGWEGEKGERGREREGERGREGESHSCILYTRTIH